MGITPLSSLVVMAHKHYDKLYRNEGGERSPLTAVQFRVMSYLASHPGCIQTDIVQGVGVDRSTLSSILYRLAYDGLITRPRDPECRRKVLVTPTPKGYTALATATDIGARAQNNFALPLSSAEQRSLRAILTKIVGDNVIG